jgi:hypothetical protein
VKGSISVAKGEEATKSTAHWLPLVQHRLVAREAWLLDREEHCTLVATLVVREPWLLNR